jgi:hypothetical protein
MTQHDYLGFLKSLEGQCQQQRFPPALAPQSTPIDVRTPEQLIAAIRSGGVKTQTEPSQDLLPSEDDPNAFARDGQRPPQHGLLLAIADLLSHPQELLNTFTARHLAMQYTAILDFLPRPALPYRAWVAIELKKTASPLPIGVEHRFVAGDTPDGQPRLMKPTQPVFVHHAQLVEIARRTAKGGRAGAERVSYESFLQKITSAGWTALGETHLPAARTGFAIASPLLRLSEGIRHITISLVVENPKSVLESLPLDNEGKPILKDLFQIEYSCTSGWHQLTSVDADWSGEEGCIRFILRVDGSCPPIVDFFQETHGDMLATNWPAIRFTVNQPSPVSLCKLSNIGLKNASLQVNVKDLRSLTVKTKHGIKNTTTPFTLFGPQVSVGDIAIFEPLCSSIIFYSKATLTLTMRTDNTGINTTALDSPPSYPVDFFPNHSTEVTTTINFDRNSSLFSYVVSSVSNLPQVTQPRGFVSQFIDDPHVLVGLMASNLRALTEALLIPSYETSLSLKANWKLPTATYHTYLSNLAIYANRRAEGPLPTPPTLELLDASLNYETRQEMSDLDDLKNTGFSTNLVQFFHLDSFGARREHAAIRALSPAKPVGQVGLTPDGRDTSELFLGFEHVTTGAPLSLLFDIVSSNVTLEQQGTIEWSVLCGNHWKTLRRDEILLDSTRHLTQSGLLQITIPSIASTEHTIMPPGKLWIRGRALNGLASDCKLRGVYCHAIELIQEQGALPQEINGLPAGTVTDIVDKTTGVQRVVQPLPGFGGRPTETQTQLYRRASERLRHRNRAVTIWDFERLVLEEFCDIERVKCIPHADGNSWFRPGHVTVVVVPNAGNAGTARDLQPRLSASRLAEVSNFLRDRCVPGVEPHVINACYEEITCTFKVAFNAGLPNAIFRTRLNDSLTQHLAPWTAGDKSAIRFGGTVFRSTVIDFLEDIEYVDYITDFTFQNSVQKAPPNLTEDRWVLSASRPDGILTSALTHDISVLD